MHIPSICTAHRTVPEALFRSDMADHHNIANNASTLCGLTWEKWTKTIAYVETIFGTLTVVVIPIFLMELSSVKNNLVIREDSKTNATYVFNNNDSSYLFIIMAGNAGIATSKITESQYEFVKGYHVTLFILQLAFTVLAIYIVIGVTKKNLKHIIQGIFLKMGLLLLSVILFLCQLIVLVSCGYGSDIWRRLCMIVGDAMFIMIVNNYFKCERDAVAASNQNAQLPKFLFGLLNTIFSIKIPYLMAKK